MTARRLFYVATLSVGGLWLARLLFAAKTADLGSATAGQILCGDVDGVDLAQLGADVLAHDHQVSGNVSDATETLTITDVDGNAISVLTATTSGGLGATNEGGIAGSGSRTHNHASSDGSGALTTDTVVAATALSAKTDGDILVAHANGGLTCDLIDGIAPEVLYDRYDGHYHTLTGYTAYASLSSLPIYGNSGNAWFWVRKSGGAGYWAQVVIQAGSHRHAAGNIVTRAENAGSGAGSDDAGNPKFAVNPTTGAISLCGDVNGIGIAQFKTKYDAHFHAPSGAIGDTGLTQIPAQIREAGTLDEIEMLKDGTTWLTAYIYPTPHGHGGGGLTIGTPI